MAKAFNFFRLWRLNENTNYFIWTFWCVKTKLCATLFSTTFSRLLCFETVRQSKVLAFFNGNFGETTDKQETTMQNNFSLRRKLQQWQLIWHSIPTIVVNTKKNNSDERKCKTWSPEQEKPVFNFWDTGNAEFQSAGIQF